MFTKLIINNIYGAGVVLTTCFLSATIANAQPVPDATLPNNSEVNLEDSTYQINGGTVAGENLFHSFDSFSVPTGTEAIFNNDLAIQNILTRVTGNSVSNIDGLLKTMGNANLFFLNPNGIIFGPNSSLNIGGDGSLIISTADMLQFSDGTEFSASNPQTSPLLTISTPVGLQFGDQVGDISIQAASLELLNPLKTFALVGGDFNLEGGSIFAQGNIELGSVASNSQVNLIPIEAGWTLDYENVENFQDIRFGQAATAEDRALEFPVALFTNKLQIQGRNISLLQGKQFIILQNATVSASDTLKISGSNQETDLIAGDDPNFSRITGESADENNGGDLFIDTGRLIIQDGGQITSEVSGTFNLDGDFTPATGNGGDVIINATESIELVDENSAILSSTSGFGSAGKTTINTQDLSVSNGAIITAESTGVDSNEEPLATGLGGEIEINASESIRLNDGVISSSTSGLGDNAGSVSLETNQLSVLEGSEISVNASGSGLAGNLEIAANSIEIDRGYLNAETQAGSQGNITLSNLDTLLMDNNSQITTNATESATGGDITISSEAIALLNNSDITANAVQGQGGNIQITTQRIFQEPDSQITAASELGIDGTITINNPNVDPTSGILELPAVLIDAEEILAQDLCRLEEQRIARGSSFIITGRGGLTPTSEGTLENRDRIVNWARREDLEVSDNGTVGIRQREEDSLDKQYPEIKQSQGLVVAADGSTWLTANVPNTVPQSSKTGHPDCQTLESETKN